jgi:hypothetical protein
MSDTILQSDAFRPQPSRTPDQAAATGGPRRRRIKLLGDLVDYVAEVMAEMERGRQVHPVISAYRR